MPELPRGDTTKIKEVIAKARKEIDEIERLVNLNNMPAFQQAYWHTHEIPSMSEFKSALHHTGWSL